MRCNNNLISIYMYLVFNNFALSKNGVGDGFDDFCKYRHNGHNKSSHTYHVESQITWTCTHVLPYFPSSLAPNLRFLVQKGFDKRVSSSKVQ